MKKYEIIPCELCNSIHPLKIHSYPWRSWKEMGTGEKQKGRIITAFCETSKVLDTKYTIRLLPDFLIPYAVIRSDSALEALKEDSKKHSLEKTCQILGCLDFRTARKYLNYGIQAVNKASLALSERLISFAGQYSHLKALPDTSALFYFESLVAGFNNLQISIHGGLAYEIKIPPEFFIGSNWPKLGAQKPTTFVSAPEDSPDKT